MKYDTIEQKARKYHYWRGFRSGLIATVPVILALVYVLNVALNAMQ